jgi:hypothetical protein
MIKNEVTLFWVDTRECRYKEKLEESLREVRRIVPTTLGPASVRPLVAFDVNPGPELDACLANVSIALAAK